MLRGQPVEEERSECRDADEPAELGDGDQQAARRLADRAAYGRHVGEPAWESFIERLTRASSQFAQMWATGDVAAPGPRIKMVQHASVGEMRLTASSLTIDGMPEHRIVVYTPNDEESRERVERLRAVADPLVGCPAHARPVSQILAAKTCSSV
ncbi:hypothetical protein NGB36_15305 [Streptomyces sp. RB6PN25]|uniref:MmyB-like transcription regulator ligand binding domain-containing protein n=1 Tax=Streptomyces humicola TaxID=2953240 RepID=A0ABT1PWC1_9ACTN|nr:hypothetical protein [Streptomyces humicola]MCQ4081939.1 hypothetical protein [Streptomyces humicola]